MRTSPVVAFILAGWFCIPALGQQAGSDGAAPAAGVRRIRISRAVSTPMLVERPKPEYPREAIDKRVEGAVQIYVLTDNQGAVRETRLISGNPLLGPVAIAAVKNWKYRPCMMNGAAMELETSVMIDFRLHDGKTPAVIAPVEDGAASETHVCNGQ